MNSNISFVTDLFIQLWTLDQFVPCKSKTAEPMYYGYMIYFIIQILTLSYEICFHPMALEPTFICHQLVNNLERCGGGLVNIFDIS